MSSPNVILPASLDWLARLQPWREVGILEAADVHIADRLATLAGLTADDHDVVLAVALAARAPRCGHVCLDLRTVAGSIRTELDTVSDEVVALRRSLLASLPTTPTEVEAWRTAIAASPLVSLEDSAGSLSAADRPLVLHGELLYLERYRDYEVQVAAEVHRRVAAIGGSLLGARAEQLLTLMNLSDEQRAAVLRGLHRSFSVIVGGPGTGKTHTVAALLAVLLDTDPDLRIALVAPTGKAAARLGEAIGGAAATLAGLDLEGATDLADRLLGTDPRTVHRLLGWRPGSSRFRHGPADPLPHDVVIVDETSMVSLPLLAHLLAAVPETSRIVLVGDPGQLASVEAGSVLGDIVAPVVTAATNSQAPPTSPIGESISVLLESRRFPGESPVGRFAAAVRSGDADTALALLHENTLDPSAPATSSIPPHSSSSSSEVTVLWCPQSVAHPAAVTAVRDAALSGVERMRDAARLGDVDAALGLLTEVRVLCAHRHGLFGVSHWNTLFDRWAGLGGDLTGIVVGRPVMITRNDPANDLSNGDLGVVVGLSEPANADPIVRVAFDGAGGSRLFSPARLEQFETVHAMTIHKSQGSEFDTVVVVLPPADSPLATRELLYTAVTRARHRVVLVGDAEAIAVAIRTAVVRASGLGARLWGAA